jgi:hypothetical protein
VGSTPTEGTTAIYLLIFVRELSTHRTLIAMTAFPIHTQLIHILRRI